MVFFVPALRKFRPMLAVAFGLLAFSASAQINEPDRLARCENNRARIVELQHQLTQTWGDEQAARARVALVGLNALAGRIRRMNQQLSAELLAGIGPQADYERYNAHRQERDGLMVGFLARAREIGIGCRVADEGCPDRAIGLIGREIDGVEANRPTRQALETQLAAHRNNLVALHCDETAAAPEGCGLGSVWDEQESGFMARWDNQGGGRFVAFYTAPDGRTATTTNRVRLSGNLVFIDRLTNSASDATLCHYTGTLEGGAITGTYECPGGFQGSRPWHAVVHCSG